VNGIHEVRGSIPLGSTNRIILLIQRFIVRLQQNSEKPHLVEPPRCRSLLVHQIGRHLCQGQNSEHLASPATNTTDTWDTWDTGPSCLGVMISSFTGAWRSCVMRNDWSDASTTNRMPTATSHASVLRPRRNSHPRRCLAKLVQAQLRLAQARARQAGRSPARANLQRMPQLGYSRRCDRERRQTARDLRTETRMLLSRRCAWGRLNWGRLNWGRWAWGSLFLPSQRGAQTRHCLRHHRSSSRTLPRAAQLHRFAHA
jgi:hypothetical protein